MQDGEEDAPEIPELPDGVVPEDLEFQPPAPRPGMPASIAELLELAREQMTAGPAPGEVVTTRFIDEKLRQLAETELRPYWDQIAESFKALYENQVRIMERLGEIERRLR